MPKQSCELGFGSMRLPKADGKIDRRQTAEMIDRFLAHGCRCFDTAYVYEGGDSERALRECLVQRYPRERFLLADKFPIWQAQSAEDLDRCLRESLSRCGVDYFDRYLLHNVGGPRIARYEELGAWPWLLGLKERGLARQVGFSFHDGADKLEETLQKHPEVDFVQLQLNYADWEDPRIQSRRCYEIARRFEKPIIVMEPAKGGSLAVLPPAARALLQEARPELPIGAWPLRWCASLPGVCCVLSGVSDLTQVEENCRALQDFSALSEEEYALIGRVMEIVRAMPVIACTNCRYCMEDCPAKINIPDCIETLNQYRVYGSKTPTRFHYQWMTGNGWGRAGDCLRCGRGEELCTQHLPVMEAIAELSALFDE